jgi:hypothetical protein
MGKYNNPIAKPETVTLPRWEYARLLESRTILATLRLLVENDKGYDALTLMKLMVENEKKEG